MVRLFFYFKKIVFLHKVKKIVMKKSIFLILLLTMLTLSVSSCTKLRAGDTFVYNHEGVVYTCEVIVSKMKYVRISPVAATETLSGTVEIPSKVKYNGKKFTVTQIAENAFRGYSSITSVVLPSTLSVIENGAFSGCVSLKTVNTPQPLSSIGNSAFEDCEALVHFSLDASISSLGEACFKNCSSLADISIPSSFSDIPKEAFYGCVSLTNLELSATIMHIGDAAFEGCSGLKTVYMDRSLQDIGERAFKGCTAIESIKCLTAMPPRCFDSTFDGVPANSTVTVPMAQVNDYKTTTGWNHFTDFVGVY